MSSKQIYSCTLITTHVPTEQCDDDDFECPICTEVGLKNMQFQCGHLVCSWCFGRMDVHKTECPLCREKKWRHYCDVIVQKTFDKLGFKCKCGDHILMKDLLNHAKKCYKFEKACDFCDVQYTDEHKCTNPHFQCLRCDQTFKKDHICGYDLVDCENCGENMLRLNLQKHLSDICESFPCRMKGCDKAFTQNARNDHELNCKHRVIECVYKRVGCTHRCKEMEMTAHWNKMALYHAMLMQEPTLDELYSAIDRDDANRVAQILPLMPRELLNRYHKKTTALLKACEKQEPTRIFYELLKHKVDVRPIESKNPLVVCIKRFDAPKTNHLRMVGAQISAFEYVQLSKNEQDFAKKNGCFGK